MAVNPLKNKPSAKLSRRDVLKSLATLPVLGYFANRFYVNMPNLENVSSNSFSLGISGDINHLPASNYTSKGDKIRVGVVGNGYRGPQVFWALGFAAEQSAKKHMANGTPDSALENFFAQDDLNIEITGVCDTYSGRAEEAAAIVATPYRSGNAAQAKRPKIYATYRDMLADNNIDAIVIMVPDHWHEKMAVDAARAGKHIYLEKPMCQTAEEAKRLRDVIRETGVIFQVGHQNRQQASYIKAKEIVDKGVLGPVSAVETFTNRNTDHGAWIREIPAGANRSNVNWDEFLGDKPKCDFDPDKYFNWQKWFEYGTGPAGNQFTHEFDCVNQVLELGIPKQVVATGGKYYFKDPRNIPDVFNAVFNYPDKGLTLTYDCTLQNSKLRDKTFLGKEASMEVNVGVAVYPDSSSKKYKPYKLPSDLPMFTYHPKATAVDAVTSATAKYYHDRGFGYTYVDGKKMDCTYLHLKEWFYCIRNGKQPSCNVDRGFEETVTFSMANRAYLEKRVVEWDSVKEEII
jgi:predicted dehydrogenase